jgi:dTDP-4-amino-4,6-dideoxygalactose transaminase
MAQKLHSRASTRGIVYRTPIHRQPAMRAYAEGVNLPVTDEAARTHLAIPISAGLPAEDADEVVAALRLGVRMTATGSGKLRGRAA